MKTALLAIALGTLATAAEARPLRVMSLDQCADQHVLALAPDAELLLSPRADDPDAWLRDQGRAHRRARPSLEAAISFKPDVVVRYWGGDARLVARLERDGARVVRLADVSDFKGAAENLDAVATALGAANRAAEVKAHMQRDIASGEAQPAEAAMYLTAGGFTAGPGTIIDAIIRASGLINANIITGYQPVSVERMALSPPASFILGFFDQARADWRGVGRHPVVRRLSRGKVAASLPASTLTCPAWFAADAVRSIRTAK